MCTDSLTIKPKSQYYNPQTYAHHVAVPCGVCPTDQLSRATGYKLRCYYEQLGCEKHGGFSIFDTLTYCPDDLPTYDGVPCFSHKDVVDFRKLLRITLERDGFVPYVGKYGQPDYRDLLKMFIVSEYGGTTGRPHYHFIAWCTIPHLTATALHAYIHKCWTHGFTDRKLKTINIKHDGIGAIHYVTKYMEKCNLERDKLRKDMEQLREHYCKERSVEDLEKLAENAPEHFSLRCWSSRGLGEYAFEFLSQHPNYFKQFVEHGVLPIPDAKNCIKMLPVPHFYKYRFFYDRTYNEKSDCKNLYILNSCGLNEILSSFEAKRDKYAEKISRACARMSPLEINRLASFSGRHLTDFPDLYRDLATYALAFNGVSSDTTYTIDRWREVLIDTRMPDLKTARNCYAWSDEFDDYDIELHEEISYKNQLYLKDDYLCFLDMVLSVISPYLRDIQLEKDERTKEKQAHYDALRSLRARSTKPISFTQFLSHKSK